MQMKLSIIIPVYNIERFLRECLNSVINQTAKSYEVIVVDDGSTDSSLSICEEFAHNYDIITAIHKENGGLSSARNEGLKHARGEYISFVDGDDYIDNNYIEILLKALDKEYDLLSFRYKAKIEKSVEIHPNKTEYIKSFFNESDNLDFLISEIYMKINWSAWSHVYKRSILEKYNLIFEDNNKIFAEDMYFLFSYCSLIKNAKFISNPLYNYRLRQNSIMNIEKRNLNVGRMNELSKCLFSFYKRNNKRYFIEQFPLIHYLVIRQVLYRALIYNDLPQKKFRDMVINDIEDKKFFFLQVEKLISDREMFFKYINDKNAEYDFDYLRYIYDGSRIKSKIRTLKRKIKNRGL